MANEIRTPGVPQNPAPQVPTQRPAVLREAEKVVQPQQQPANKLSPQDAARLAQQAGFQRTQKRRGASHLDVDDLGRTPIPVPEEEGGPEAWDGEKLNDAQQHMALMSARLAEIATEESSEPFAERLISLGFLPTEEDLCRLESLSGSPEPEALPSMDEAAENVRKLFGVELSSEVPLGHALLVAGLVVAGEGGHAAVKGGAVDEQKLASGMKTIVQRSNQAVGDAQKMNMGINRELNLQRTFVFKR